VPEIFFPVRALLFRDHQVHGPQHRSRRVDGHGYCRFLEVNAAEEDFHVLQRIDGHATFANFAFARRMIRVITHQRWQIESY